MPVSSPKKTSPKITGASNYWIQQAGSAIHGRGVRARRAIPAGARITEYTGERITKAEALRRDEARLARLRRGGDGSVYVFELNKRHDLDGRLSRNIARFINHSCAPNCETAVVRGRVWISALRDIAEGEELTYDYGFPYSEWRGHPCRCGAPGCVGFIVNKAQRWLVRKALRKEKQPPPAKPPRK
ncbi:MAG: SET domain-containing protein-lysine N-methyltransferase [Opitutaceae bacterium]|jgi:SET domain-containing protein|nr:SET domain-containing protein-lysine N-methyltransferase [Opitutaceae bacterium]